MAIFRRYKCRRTPLSTEEREIAAIAELIPDTEIEIGRGEPLRLLGEDSSFEEKEKGSDDIKALPAFLNLSWTSKISSIPWNHISSH
jgi:hypothetical protein